MKRFPLVLTIITLIIIPFFWFKPGEVNLGGDSSRLYFYNPKAYLESANLYNIAPGQTGGEMISYFFIPFVLLLLFLKFFIASTSILINVYHSFMLVSSFLFIYLSITEILRVTKKHSKFLISIVSIIGGLFYSVFSILAYNWDKALITHNQIFLNPLCFYLLLRYVVSDNILYALLCILITFIFAPNFSFIGAPSFFAFYPFVVFFLFLYKRFVLKTPFYWKTFSFLLLIFLSIHSFHLIPQVLMFFNSESNSYQRVFSLRGSIDALQYFKSVASNIKLSNNLVTTPSFISKYFTWDFLYLVFPTVIIVATIILAKKGSDILARKTLLLLSLLFLIVVFFDTANITAIGFLLYSFLFKFPGSAMFRNYYGQFLYAYYFFYALVFSYALYFILIHLSKLKQTIFIVLLLALFLTRGWYFIRGDMVNLPFYQENNVKVPITIDPNLELALQYIGKEPIDGKVLTLPLTDFGYQVFQGTHGGVYMGPSTIGFLTNKKDFPGYEGFGPFAELLLSSIEKDDYKSIKNLLAILNIRYIFYNSDPYIYDQHFKIFPYNTVRKYFPNQKSVQEFINNIGAKKVKDIGGKYHIYELDESLPHIYVAQNDISINQASQFEFLLSQRNLSAERIAISNQVDYRGNTPFLAVNKIDIFTTINKDYPIPVQYPYAKWELSSPIYPFVVVKEQYKSKNAQNNNDVFVDLKILYATKRVSEIVKWEGRMPLTENIQEYKELLAKGQRLEESPLTNFNKYNTINSSLARYLYQIDSTISFIEHTDTSFAWKIEKLKRVEEVLKNNEEMFELVLKNSNRKEEEKQEIKKIVNYIDTFKRRITLYNYTPGKLGYAFPSSIDRLFNAKVYAEKGNALQDGLRFVIGTQSAAFLPYPLSDRWFETKEVSISPNSTLFTIDIPINENYSGKWEAQEIKYTPDLDHVILETHWKGFTKKIPFIKEGHYLINFDYKTGGDLFDISFSFKDKKNNYRYIFKEPKISKDWKEFNAVVKAEAVENEGYIHIDPVKNATNERIEIKNFRVTKLPFHNEILIVESKQLKENHVPRIIFKRINPTKYKVTVKGVKNPFSIIFLEEYNKKWKLYPYDERSDCTSLISHFGGEIQEGCHENSFIVGKLLNSFFKKSIADNKHFVINEYANGWQIEPSDIGNRSEVTFIIEIESQRVFYLSLLISGTAFVLLLFLIMKLSLKR